MDAASNLQRSKTEFARWLNAQTGTAFDVDETNPDAQDLPPAEEALRVALTSRSEYQAALARVETAKAAAAAVRAKRLPSAQLHADSGFDGSSPVRGIVTYRVFGTLQIPLFHAEQGPEEAEAEARLREAQATADELRSAVEAEVREALDDAAASSPKIAVAGEIRDLAQAEVELTSRRVAAGVSDNTEELAAQERLLRAEEEIARIRLESRKRRVELYIKIGKPDDVYR
jgi:outer membrane protein TolC